LVPKPQVKNPWNEIKIYEKKICFDSPKWRANLWLVSLLHTHTRYAFSVCFKSISTTNTNEIFFFFVFVFYRDRVYTFISRWKPRP
jgi:hypothetical protein